MGSGLSMASVNKIKELAESRDYSVAVDILDAQDLDKSLNPQFVRTCGEVYENVGRYIDARKQYVRAHIMADGNSKVIQSLIILYLKRGFKELAQKYYEHYVFIEKDSPRKIADIDYIMKKAEGEATEEMYDILFPYYRDNMDEQWSYELILLSVILGKFDGFDILVSDYLATFKNSKRIENIEAAFGDKKKAEKMFYVFSEEARTDDDPLEDEIRQMEAEQLEKDYFTRNPKEPEILLMVDDLNDELTDKQKRKAERKNRKEFLKSVRKEAESRKEGEDIPSGENDSEDTEQSVQDDSKEATAGESIKHSIKDFIKRKFRREDSSKEEDSSEDTEAGEDGEIEEEAKPSEEGSDTDKTGKGETGENTAGKNGETKDNDPEAKPEENGKTEKADTEEISGKSAPVIDDKEKADKDKTETVDNKVDEGDAGPELSEKQEDEAIVVTDAVNGSESEDSDDSQSTEDKAGDSMRELKPDTSIDDLISYDFDDGFAPESDTIAELDDSPIDFSNPFDSINAYKKDEEEKRNSELETTGKTFDDLRIELEINNVDDTTSDNEPEQEIIEPEEIAADLADKDILTGRDTVDQTEDETAEDAVEEDTVDDEAAEDAVEEDTVYDKAAGNAVEEDKVYDETAGDQDDEQETVEKTEEAEDVSETVNVTAEADEAVEEEKVETAAESEDTDEVTDEKTFDQTEADAAEEAVETKIVADKDSSDREEEKTAANSFPEFKTTLFSERETYEAKDELEDVKKKESELDERLRKEAELQKQAEELLKSLGIDI